MRGMHRPLDCRPDIHESFYQKVEEDERSVPFLGVDVRCKVVVAVSRPAIIERRAGGKCDDH